MRKIRLIPDNTNIRFMLLRRINFPVSVVLSVLSVVFFIAIGPQYGIDFRGGSLIEIKPHAEPYDLGAIRSTLAGLNLGDVQVTEISDPVAGTSVLIRIQQQEGGDTAQEEAIGKVRAAFGDTVEFRRVETVGPRVSGELAYDATVALIVTLIAILIYIWFRFEWQFAVGAIVATGHDVLMTLGFFVVARVDFDLTSIAAILTIVGYSLNDTVVVYDRIRENLRKYKKMPLIELLDRSVNETLSRTTQTSLTTMLALLALFFFGGEVIRSFVAAMIFGVAIGTYSSIYIAAPVLIYFKLRPAAPSAAKEEGSRRRRHRGVTRCPPGRSCAPRTTRAGRRSTATATAAFASPACRIAALSCACRAAFTAGPRRRPMQSTRKVWPRFSLKQTRSTSCSSAPAAKPFRLPTTSARAVAPRRSSSRR